MLTKVVICEYFHGLSNFNYEKAKLIIEACSSSLKGETRSTSFLRIQDCFLSLLILEKKYHNLSFLSNRRKSIFSRKEKYAEGYQELFDRATVLVFERISDDLGRECLLTICSIRSRMTDMYLSMSQMSRDDTKSWIDLVALVRPIKECLVETLARRNETVVEMIDPLLALIELEVDTLLHLGEAQNLMSNLYFLVPINLLYSADEKIQRLHRLTSSFSTSSTIFSRSVHPLPLVDWMSKFYVSSLAKYTLYFHSVLMRQKQTLLAPNELLVENASLDLLHRVSVFVKKTCASSLLLIFDAAKQNVPFLGHGYVFPFSRGEKVSGLQSFPIIFCWPLESEVSKPLLCTLVTLVLKVKHSSSAKVALVDHVIEPNNSRTVFLSQVEERMYLAIVFEGRPEKEKVVYTFMEELGSELTGGSILEELVSMGS